MILISRSLTSESNLVTLASKSYLSSSTLSHFAWISRHKFLNSSSPGKKCVGKTCAFNVILTQSKIELFRINLNYSIVCHLETFYVTSWTYSFRLRLEIGWVQSKLDGPKGLKWTVCESGRSRNPKVDGPNGSNWTYSCRSRLEVGWFFRLRFPSFSWRLLHPPFWSILE